MSRRRFRERRVSQRAGGALSKITLLAVLLSPLEFVKVTVTRVRLEL